MVNIIGNKNSIFNQFVYQIRDIDIQQDRFRFRKNIERIGEIFAYEISKTLKWSEKEVTTPLGTLDIPLLDNYPVIASILRAGLPLHQGMLNYFDQSDNAFISAYRKPNKVGAFNIQIEYTSSPDLTGKTLILCDAMLATGASMVLTYKELISKGIPEHTHIVAVLASVQGVEYVEKHLPSSKVTLWVGAIDDELTAEAYIVPGLGDAGDLAFGEKM
ncbi:MAG: uracil phosphoribosyltransferase [Bacteroidales bacterium]|nr:uracil phosphoribosyltransferase [Bacteroidales bacterium]